MRLAALNTRRAGSLRARHAPRAIPITVLDSCRYPKGLLLLALTAPSALRRGWLRIHIHPSLVRVGALPTHRRIPRGSTATGALRPTSFPASPAVAVRRRWRRGRRCGLGRFGFGFRAGMSFGLGCQFACEDFGPPFERTASARFFG